MASTVAAGSAAVSAGAGAAWLFKGAAGLSAIAGAVGEGNLLVVSAAAGAVAIGAYAFGEG